MSELCSLPRHALCCSALQPPRSLWLCAGSFRSVQRGVPCAHSPPSLPNCQMRRQLAGISPPSKPCCPANHSCYLLLPSVAVVCTRYELGAEEDESEAARRKDSTLNTRFHVMLVGAAVAAAVGVLHVRCGEMGYGG